MERTAWRSGRVIIAGAGKKCHSAEGEEAEPGKDPKQAVQLWGGTCLQKRR